MYLRWPNVQSPERQHHCGVTLSRQLWYDRHREVLIAIIILGYLKKKRICDVKNTVDQSEVIIPSTFPKLYSVQKLEQKKIWTRHVRSRIQSRVDSESRFAIFLVRILWKIRLASRENISASLTSLARREKYDILWSLRVSQFTSLAVYNSQTSKIVIHSEKLGVDPKFSQDSIIKISNDSRESRYEISVCKTRESCYEICLRDSWEASLTTEFLSARLVRSDSC